MKSECNKKEHILIARVGNWNNNNSSSGLVTHLFLGFRSE